MKSIYFDCYSGVSGDMILGALTDAGLDLDSLRAVLATLQVGPFELRRRSVRRCGLAATKVDVAIDPQGADGLYNSADGSHHHADKHEENASQESASEEYASAEDSIAHSHEDHSHEHHSRDHPRHEPQDDNCHLVLEDDKTSADPNAKCEGARAHSHHSRESKSYQEIIQIISGGGLSDRAREGALRAYRLLAEAESHVHQIPLRDIHFHEVGGADAILDIAGAFAAFDLMGVEDVWCSEITTGFGSVRTAHGWLPVPAPATAELLAGIPTKRGDVEGERATPTGAAILRAAAKGFGDYPPGFAANQTAYGAGGREFPGQTNFLRVFVGERPDQHGAASEFQSMAFDRLNARTLCLLQTEIDDMSGQVYSFLYEKLFALGCLDVTLAPIQMKKNRPASRVEVLCAPDRRNALVECLLRETTTFGIKVREIERICLDRRFEKVATPYGDVRMKLGFAGDIFLKASPEYEDCRALAAEKNVTLIEVMDAARRAFHAKQDIH